MLDGRKAAAILLLHDLMFRSICRLCMRCMCQGVIAPADPAAWEAICRGHLAEDRINELLKGRDWP